MHCVSAYPCGADKINLPKFKFLQSLSPRVGYSGHYQGSADAIAAISLGATVIEKHLTIDHDLPGRDNKFALLPEQFKEISDFNNLFPEMNADRGLGLQECEENYRTFQKGRWG